jgi:hypothetical protein
VTISAPFGLSPDSPKFHVNILQTRVDMWAKKNYPGKKVFVLKPDTDFDQFLPAGAKMGVDKGADWQQVWFSICTLAAKKGGVAVFFQHHTEGFEASVQNGELIYALQKQKQIQNGQKQIHPGFEIKFLTYTENVDDATKWDADFADGKVDGSGGGGILDMGGLSQVNVWLVSGYFCSCLPPFAHLSFSPALDHHVAPPLPLPPSYCRRCPRNQVGRKRSILLAIVCWYYRGCAGIIILIAIVEERYY